MTYCPGFARVSAVPRPPLAKAEKAGLWRLEFSDGQAFDAATVVNATGAWADHTAERFGVQPVGLVPKRRSAFTFRAPAAVDASGWPLVAGLDDSYYFKPDAGQLLGSPGNADPTHAHDVQPEDLDIAAGIHALTARLLRAHVAWRSRHDAVTACRAVNG